MALPRPPATHISISCATVLPWHAPLIAAQLTTLTISAPPCSLLGRQRLYSLVLAGLPASSFFTLSQIQAEPSCQMDSPLQRGPGSCSQSFSTSVALQTLAVTVRSSAGHQKYSTLSPPTTPAVPDYSNLSVPMAAPCHPGVMVSSHGLAFLSVSPSSSLSRSLHIYSPTNPSGLARCLSSPNLPLSLRQKRSVACHPFQFLPATSILGYPSNQTVRLGALLGGGSFVLLIFISLMSFIGMLGTRVLKKCLSCYQVH